MLTLFYDSETTGLFDRALPSLDPSQPHIVQLAALLVDADGNEVAAMNEIVRPDGWTIPDEAARIHGITHWHALKVGRPETEVIAQFYFDFFEKAALRVAHNEPFDAKVIRIAVKRFLCTPEDESRAERWSTAQRLCTMKMATPILKMAPTERMIAAGFGDKPKSPKLSECIRFFFDEPLDGAHDALVDVRACARLYRHILNTQTQEAAVA